MNVILMYDMQVFGDVGIVDTVEFVELMEIVVALCGLVFYCRQKGIASDQ